MSRILHCSVDIDYAIANCRYDMVINGCRVSPEKAERILRDSKARGHQVVQMGECEGFDPVTGCPGHWEKPKLELVP